MMSNTGSLEHSNASDAKLFVSEGQLIAQGF